MATNFGIEDIRFAFPSLYMDLADLANARDIEPAKLQKGLGLLEMSVCDVHEDVITLAASALIDIVKSNNIPACDLGRIYVGTESSIDGSKPIASYLLGILTQYYTSKGENVDCLRNVDVVDMTFACIGAIDAMHNSLAWLRTETDKKAIVIATDIANYDLASSGEYTQGAGASAVLLQANPSIMTIDSHVGVAAECVHDFFKPLRLHTNKEIQLPNGDAADTIVNIHKETPVFDGPLSNQTYQDRIREALENFESKKNANVDLDDYDSFVFHLPYAFHGRRIFNQIFLKDLEKKNALEDFYTTLNTERPDSDTMDSNTLKSARRAWNKAIVKSESYSSLVKNKIEKGERLSSQIGNVYTASIFVSLLSTLLYNQKENSSINKMLLFAYGSGSKAKVFQGKISDSWSKKVASWDVEKQLEARTRIDFDTYVSLRLHKLDQSVSLTNQNVMMNNSGILETNRYSRNYVLNTSK